MSINNTRFRCHICGKEFKNTTVPNDSWKEKKKIPKVLLFDTENAPNIATVWRVWQQNIQPAQILSDWYMLSWSAKWLFDSEMMGDVLTPREAKKENDKRLMKTLWNLLDEADIVIAHNIDFDVPVVNTRFLLNDIKPPSPYQVIDTLKVARKQFNFAHNKLDFLADKLDIPHKKLETEHQLWVDCRAGKQEALDYMLKYNKMDVLVLEELYMKLRAWIKPHPNFNLYTETQGCSTCGNPTNNLIKKGTYATTVNKFDSYYCPNCHSYSRAGISGKKTNLRSIAR